MITEEKKTHISGSISKSVKEKLDKVIIEIQLSNEIKKFVIPYHEWLAIEKWYCNTEAAEDYLLKLKNGNNSYRIIRLNKQISEIKILKIDRSKVTSKNVSRILFSSVPGALKFVVPFCLSLVLWSVMGIISLINIAEVDVVSPGIRLTSLTFILFFLLNAQFAVFKTIDFAKNKYEAFISEFDGYITDTLLFNMGLIFLFVIVGMRNIVGWIESFLQYINIL